MSQTFIDRIVIVGGGTAGWMAAARSRALLKDRARSITLVESDEIGTVGVGEATIPPHPRFNQMLGIDEDEFVRQTQGTFKLGIEFVDWGAARRALFPSVRQATAIDYRRRRTSTSYWLRQRSGGDARHRRLLDDARGRAACAAASRGRARIARLLLSSSRYAFHFDAALYAAFLRELCRAARRAAHRGQDRRRRAAAEDGFIDARRRWPTADASTATCSSTARASAAC